MCSSEVWRRTNHSFICILFSHPRAQTKLSDPSFQGCMLTSKICDILSTLSRSQAVCQTYHGDFNASRTMRPALHL
ncbi:hypothetical protein B0H12DRAFT_1137827 [Mycena haematopus]|nr:hypothetical protein B0H12DRAFT_1137827 [Mycena haematopus]